MLTLFNLEFIFALMVRDASSMQSQAHPQNVFTICRLTALFCAPCEIRQVSIMDIRGFQFYWLFLDHLTNMKQVIGSKRYIFEGLPVLLRQKRYIFEGLPVLRFESNFKITRIGLNNTDGNPKVIYVNHVYDEKKRCHGDQCFDKVLTNSCNIICALSFLRAFIDAILQGDPFLLPFNYSEGLNHLPEVLGLPESKLTVHEQKTDDVNFPDILGRIASQLEDNNNFLEISRFYDSDIRSLARLFCQDNAKGKILISFLNEEELRSLVERCYSQYLKVVRFLDAYSYRITSSYTPDSLYLCIFAMMDFSVIRSHGIHYSDEPFYEE